MNLRNAASACHVLWSSRNGQDHGGPAFRGIFRWETPPKNLDLPHHTSEIAPGLEYAIMSGGDVAPLEEQAVTELHKLFRRGPSSVRCLDLEDPYPMYPKRPLAISDGSVAKMAAGGFTEVAEECSSLLMRRGKFRISVR